MTVAEESGLSMWTAELFRRKSAILLQISPENRREARADLARAIEIATSQNARALLLRALSDNLRISGDDERSVAYAALASLCNSLTEGSDFVDVVKARRLLETST
jgi:predicted ATPase